MVAAPALGRVTLSNSYRPSSLTAERLAVGVTVRLTDAQPDVLLRAAMVPGRERNAEEPGADEWDAGRVGLHEVVRGALRRDLP